MHLCLRLPAPFCYHSTSSTCLNLYCFMHQRIFYCLVLLVCARVNAQTKTNYTQEPPVQYEVLLNGKVYPITEAIPKRISGTFNNPEIRVHTLPYRHFENEVLVFDYPIYFNFNFVTTSQYVHYYLLTM